MTAPVVLVAPAMAVPSGFYRPLVQAFEARGWDAEALPRRGFGRGEEPAARGHDWSYADEAADVEAAIVAAREKDPARPVVLLGHSLGAQLGAAVQLGEHPSDGFVVIGASVPHHTAYPYRGLPLLLLASLIPVITRVRGFLPKPFFGAPGAATLMREWARFTRTGRPPFDVPRRSTVPSLVVHLQGDAYAVSKANKEFVDLFLDPASTTRWVCTKDAMGPDGTTDHVQWVRTPDVVVDKVVDWWTSLES